MEKPHDTLTVAFLVVAAGITTVLQRRKSLASWSFLAGMLVLAVEAVLKDVAASAETWGDAIACYAASFVAASLLPGCWDPLDADQHQRGFRWNLGGRLRGVDASASGQSLWDE